MNVELQHAVRYAVETTKVFLMDEYKALYPHVFSDATLVVTPADSKTDYYVPESLRDECIVVRETRFDETGCRRVGCFPYRDDMSACESLDGPRWIPLGSGYTLACQPACVEEYRIDTEWIDGRCVQVNPHKKLMAMFPEKMFDLVAKEHGGLEWEKGKLRLTKEYCAAYGLDFTDGDCVLTGAQNFGEIIFGKTIVRQIKTVAAEGIKRGPPPTDGLDFPAHVSRGVNVDAIDSMPLPERTEDMAKELAKEIAVDFGIDVSAKVVANALKKQTPKLIQKAVRDVAFKSALKQAVFKSMTQAGIKAAMVAGKAVTTASGVLAVYGIVSLILDVYDPFDYEKVMDASMLSKIEKRLDSAYFNRETDHLPELTPEFVWDFVLPMDDEFRRHEFFAARVTEYMEALRLKKAVIHSPPKAKMFRPTVKEEPSKRNVAIVLVALICMVIFYEWIHVWCFALLVTIGLLGKDFTSS